MNRAILSLIGLTLFLSGTVAFAEAESLSQFAMRRCIFIWDCGTESYAADPDDVFFDWTIPCDLHASTLSYAEANRAECSEPRVEITHVQTVLKEFQLRSEIFNGSVLRARLGHSGGPLFVLAPAVHPLMRIDASKRAHNYSRSCDLHLSNILDFLQVLRIARERGQSVSNVSEMMNLLLDGQYLRRVRQIISKTMRRDDYPSDEHWAQVILKKGRVDASTFLSFVFENSDTLTHLPIESQNSYIRSALLNIILNLRERLGTTPEQTLYETFSMEYELGLAYTGHLEHRYSGSILLKPLRKSWRLFKRYSQLPAEPLSQVVLSTCKNRSQNMVAQLKDLVRTKRTDFYLVTIGPLHLHGVLEGLEQNGFSYLLIAPIGTPDHAM